MKTKLYLVPSLLVLLTFGGLQAGNFKLDNAHTGVGFKIKHLTISNVSGSFKDFSGKFAYDEATGTLTDLDVTIKAASIHTNDEKRDGHLKGKDFFNVDDHPSLTFKAKKATVKKGGVSKVQGELTIKGVTKPVTLEVKFSGSAKDPWGNTHLGFEAETKIKRADFDIAWNKPLEKGGLLIGEEVSIRIEGEALPE
ncbi:YceI family protein [Leptospira licerasiae]|uniref:YceI-like domain protein n=1 Tax=Leptospira licerasiae str. MMD4847 TaxID=1049971 RepID=A0ABP2RC60_9LEPT|nr:YceI family protein [Leptospira licerasiae]EIE02864.1 YceI-like domain protein [Leptospira licerasiae serovar Varillal str. VAR 010]EJZ40781.1 YceI-like domain protein [Leptospira licerasiae str. MMD4847]TGM90152.1 polyisoprenoid-binding protein [Leptospira licerasiae]